MFDVQIATDLTFDNIVASVTIAGTAYEPPTLNFNTQYYWRVREDGGIWTRVSFTTETAGTAPTDPVIDADGITTSPESFSVPYTADATAEYQQWQLSLDGVVVDSATNVTANPITNSEQQPGEYLFEMRSVNTAGNSAWVSQTIVLPSLNEVSGTTETESFIAE